MSESLVSVIIPTYNRVHEIEQTINSVLQQTYKNYELIVIDDGSTDGTGDLICNKYAGKVSYYYQVNQGRSAARNFGASVSKGVYLAFLDSDDYWDPRKISEQVYFLNKEKDTDVALVCCSVNLVDENRKYSRKLTVGRHPNLKNYDLEAFFYSPVVFASPSNILIKKECFEKIGGFDPSLEYGEDWELLIRLRARWKFGYIDSPLVFYRSRAIFDQDLPEARQIDLFTEQNLKVLRKSYMLLDNQVAEHVKRIMEARIYERGAFWCFCHDAWERGLEYLSQAASHDPHCLGDKRRVSLNIALWGGYSGLLKFGPDGKQIENYFRSRFLNKLNKIWPSGLLTKRATQRRILGTFYHNLSYQLTNKSDVSHYAVFAVVYEPRFVINLHNWKLILDGVL